MKKILIAMLLVLAMTFVVVPAFAGCDFNFGPKTTFVANASSTANVASLTGTFGTGVSGSYTLATNQSGAGVAFNGANVFTYANTTGGTLTTVLNGNALAGQSGSAYAFGQVWK